jgi:competence protein ComEA
VVAELVVQASGAVVHPGVYRLSADGRVDDLVREAGGLAPDADADKVNLAAPLADGERIWVPRTGETEVPAVVAGGAGSAGGAAPTGAAAPGGGGAGTTGATVPAVVDLNTATAEQLDTLPGVGPATATAILAYRDENGPFASVDDLLEVRGIGDAKLEQLRPLVSV